jgi:FAD:protein FMN transferase
VLRIERVYSRYRDDSVTTCINRAAGRQAVTLDEETAALIDYGTVCYEKSGGLFDLTSGVLRRCWNFREARVPTQAQIDAVLPLIGWQKVSWQRPRLMLPAAGMEIDFGGVGKEYAADRAAAALQNAGVPCALVNLAGDIRVLGVHPEGTPWRVGIQHPRKAEEALAYVEVSDSAIATSGDYERFFDLEGRRYCHILNPKTGYPVTSLHSVTVVAPLCIVALRETRFQRIRF